MTENSQKQDKIIKQRIAKCRTYLDNLSQALEYAAETDFSEDTEKANWEIIEGLSSLEMHLNQAWKKFGDQ